MAAVQTVFVHSSTLVHSYLDRDIEVSDVVEDEVHELLQPVLPDVSDEGLRARRWGKRGGWRRCV
jgi:hypothetical protein